MLILYYKLDMLRKQNRHSFQIRKTIDKNMKLVEGTHYRRRLYQHAPLDRLGKTLSKLSFMKKTKKQYMIKSSNAHMGQS